VIAWPRRGRRWLLVGQVACLATIVLAGRAAAERPGPSGQASWVAIAVAAALLSAAGNGVWLAALRKAASRRRHDVFTRLATHLEPSGAVTVPAPAAVAGSPPAVMIEGLTLRHRPDCPLVAGKAVVPAGDDVPGCGWCSP
jgi:hypothetical protein